MVIYEDFSTLITLEFLDNSLGFMRPLQPEVRSDLRFEIIDLNYLNIHVHIAYIVWTHFTALEATTASQVRSDLGFEI